MLNHSLFYCRIGFVFVVNKEREVEGMKDAGVAMVRAFNFIKQDKSAADGLSFFTDVGTHKQL